MFSSKTYLAALNALLAEHDLGLIELVPENPFAARLKQGMLSAFRAGSGSGFDETWWLETFNSANRVVQLNFVVMGFNELGLHPLLSGEDWQPIRNPLLIQNIESKLEKASRYISRQHGKDIRLLESQLALMDWGLADLSKHAPNIGEQVTPSIGFMSELPHPKFNTPVRMVELRELLFMYYENPRTIGEITAGISPLIKCPQAVVVTKQNQPLLIVRTEESSFGSSMLCAVEPTGERYNFGSFSRTDQDTFLRKAAEVVSKLV
jgi:hypothetical protein